MPPGPKQAGRILSELFGGQRTYILPQRGYTGHRASGMVYRQANIAMAKRTSGEMVHGLVFADHRFASIRPSSPQPGILSGLQDGAVRFGSVQ